jgi:hypothetical protein
MPFGPQHPSSFGESLDKMQREGRRGVVPPYTHIENRPVKSCPFCNSLVLVKEGHAIGCHSCGMRGPDADSTDTDEVVAKWNHRRGATYD